MSTTPPRRAEPDAPRRPPFTALAEVYDAIMQDVAYDEWCDFILREVTRRGWRGDRLLDVGCGTGGATMPMIERGYRLTALDASTEMAARARQKCPSAIVVVADVRAFELGTRVDLAYAVFDTLNTLLAEDELLAALTCVQAQLEPGGWFMFDANTSEGLRSLWEDGLAEGWAGGVHYRWQHAWDERAQRATVEAYCRTAGGDFVERHVQRPLDPDELRSAMQSAGFEAVEVIAYPSGRPVTGGEARVWALGRRPLQSSAAAARTDRATALTSSSP